MFRSMALYFRTNAVVTFPELHDGHHARSDCGPCCWWVGGDVKANERPMMPCCGSSTSSEHKRIFNIVSVSQDSHNYAFPLEHPVTHITRQHTSKMLLRLRDQQDHL